MFGAATTVWARIRLIALIRTSAALARWITILFPCARDIVPATSEPAAEETLGRPPSTPTRRRSRARALRLARASS